MAVWLYGFFVGALCGKMHSGFYAVLAPWTTALFAINGIVIYAYCKNNFLRGRAILGVVGFVWGASHNVPFAGSVNIDQKQAPLSQIVWQQTDEFGPLIARQGNQFFEVFGQARKGDLGYMRCSNDRKILLHDASCFFKPVIRNQAKSTALGDHVMDRLQRSVTDLLNQIPSHQARAFIQAAAFGKRQGLTPDVVDTFKQTGTIHLLVVSGFHVMMVFMMARKVLFFLWQSFYAFRIMRAAMFFAGSIWLEWLSFALLMLYAGMVGFSSPTARSLCVVFVMLTCRSWGMQPRLGDGIKVVLFWQLLLFPHCCINISNGLSWICYLLCLHFYLDRQEEAEGLGRYIYRLVVLQLKVCVATAALLGQISLSSIAANLLAAPLFGIIIFACLVLLLCSGAGWSTGRPLARVVNYYLDFMEELSGAWQTHIDPYLGPQLVFLNGKVWFMCVLAVIFMVWHLWCNILSQERAQN